MAITVGIMYSYVMGRYLNWYWLALSCMLPPLFMVPLTTISVESPRWLVQTNQRDDALEVLRQLRGSNRAAEEECHFIDAVFLSSPLPMSHLLLTLHTMFLQQFSGINMIIFYSTKLISDVGLTIDPANSSIILAVLQVE